KSIAGTNMPKVRIVGINHETDIKTSDGKTAGLTFMATHSLPKAAQINTTYTNVNGWKGSELHPRMQPGSGSSHDIWNTLVTADSKLTDVIKPVKKLTNNVNGEYTGTAVTSTDDYLWLPSRSELAGNTLAFSSTTYPWTNREGNQYIFFSDRKVVDNATSTILDGMDKTQNGTQPSDHAGTVYVCWWQRSCCPGNEIGFLLRYTTGYPGSNYGYPDYKLGVVPGFCL
ncbi:MAG: hypothetical protein RR477_08850, partial [Raoultibacter sp.]